MAALTSSQSGNWTSSSTWNGSTPSDGDTYTISAGHTVTISSDVRTTNGAGDINVNGRLLISNNGQLRLNGRIYVNGGTTGYFTEGSSTSGGKLEMTPGSLIEIRGANADSHGIQINAQKYTWVEMDGSDKNLNTTSSAAVTYGNSYITCSSVTGFAVGDWVSVFKRDEDWRVDGDEGFWVHDVDTTNRRLYMRQFVSPTATIQSSTTYTITVDNARVFRTGYVLIFGTGSNRNVHTVTKIEGNVITFGTAISGSVNEETVYQTGFEKKHQSGKMVKRCATTLTNAVSANNTNSIVVGDASDLAVNDYIILDVNNSNDTNWDYDSKYKITAKSGNTLTLDRNVANNHVSGSIVTIITRDVRVHAIDESSNTRVFIYHVHWTSGDAYYRRTRFRNVWFKGLGRNTNSTYYGGLFTSGYQSRYEQGSSDDRYNYESALDSCVKDGSNYRSSYTGFSNRYSNGFTMRNNISYNTEHGFWLYSTNYNLQFYNNYVTRTYYSSTLFDSVYEPYTRIQYNYMTRSDDYGMMVHHFREQIPIRHNICINHENRPFYQYYNETGVYYERFYFDGYRYFPHSGVGGSFSFLDSYFRNTWDRFSPTGSGSVYSNYFLAGASGYSDYNRTAGKSWHIQLLDYNFEKDKVAQLHGYILREWDEDGQHWICYNGDRSGGAVAEQIYVPANTTVRLSLEVKTATSGSFTFPRLYAVSQHDSYLMGQFEDSGTDTSVSSSTTTASSFSKYHGFREYVDFTSASQGNWQEKQLTIQPQPQSYFLIAGLWTSNSNIREEPFYMKNIKIFVEQAPPPAFALPKSQTKKLYVRNSFSTAKKRIGGTRL